MVTYDLAYFLINKLNAMEHEFFHIISLGKIYISFIACFKHHAYFNALTTRAHGYCTAKLLYHYAT